MEFKAQGLANTAWACATVNMSDEMLFTSLAKAAEQAVMEFSANELARMQQQVNELQSHEFANAEAFAAINLSDERLSISLARGDQRRADDFKEEHLRMLLWAWSRIEIHLRLRV